MSGSPPLLLMQHVRMYARVPEFQSSTPFKTTAQDTRMRPLPSMSFGRFLAPYHVPDPSQHMTSSTALRFVPAILSVLAAPVFSQIPVDLFSCLLSLGCALDCCGGGSGPQAVRTACATASQCVSSATTPRTCTKNLLNLGKWVKCKNNAEADGTACEEEQMNTGTHGNHGKISQLQRKPPH